MIKVIQYVGLDIGRGYVKGYSEHKGLKYQCKFKSVFALGRSIDLKDYDNPVYVEIDGTEYFVGDLAEKEGHSPTNNFKDDKTSLTCEILIMTALSQLAVESDVKIVIGVPNKLFKRSVFDKIINKYKDVEFSITDKITNKIKTIKIVDISIFREADAALMWKAKENPKLTNTSIGVAIVGFRTTELAYYDKGLKFNDKKSTTLEKGNVTALEYIDKHLTKNGIKHTLNEIDSSADYDKLKEKAYRMLSENIETDLEMLWINLKEVAIFVGGGTALHLDINHELLEDAQMVVSKGLWHVSRSVFR